MTSPSANDDHAVREAFVKWVSWQAGAPRDAESLIEHVEVSHEYAGLLDTAIEGRRVVWKAVPAAASSRLTASSVSIGAVDPWDVEWTSVRRLSDHIAVCDGCAGTQTMRCALCGGGGKSLCLGCNGRRKAYAYAVNGAYRLMNCKVCRGKGDVDCGGCQRGIAVCGTCTGEGRLQRWIEVEWWKRAAANVHPTTIAIQFGWDENPASELVTRDAQLLFDVERQDALTQSDLGDVPEQWLKTLAPPLHAGERVMRQRLRIARVPTHRVHYRLGASEDQIPFTGLRLIGPASLDGSAFGLRRSKLRSLQFLLLTIGVAITITSLGRGAFFWNVWTFLSLLACAAALIAIYLAAADWTAARRSTRPFLITAASSLVVAIAFAFIALPRAGHVQRLIAAGDLATAESELRALRDEAGAASWADLRVAQIGQTNDVAEARAALAQIPPDVAQRTLAEDAVDQLILQTARKDAGLGRWSAASDSLALLGERARGLPDSIATAAVVLVPAAKSTIERRDWIGTAKAISTARQIGVRQEDLAALDSAIHKAAVDAASNANRESDPRQRLRSRLAAEETFSAWERATGQWGTADLIALRTAMARDVAAVERLERSGRQ